MAGRLRKIYSRRGWRYIDCFESTKEGVSLSKYKIRKYGLPLRHQQQSLKQLLSSFLFIIKLMNWFYLFFLFDIKFIFQHDRKENVTFDLYFVFAAYGKRLTLVLNIDPMKTRHVYKFDERKAQCNHQFKFCADKTNGRESFTSIGRGRIHRRIFLKIKGFVYYTHHDKRLGPIWCQFDSVDGIYFKLDSYFGFSRWTRF